MSYVEIKCRDCGEANHIKKTDLAHNKIDSYEADMGAKNTWQAELEIECKCGNIITLTHSFHEYPEGTYYDHTVSADGGECI